MKRLFLLVGAIVATGCESAPENVPAKEPLFVTDDCALISALGRERYDLSRDDPPMPMGLAVADMMAGNALAQGILAALVRKARTRQGGKVETSLIEALLDFQFEVLTTYLNDGNRMPVRAAVNGAHAYLGAPYGVYKTADGWLALAMTPSLERLARASN